MSSQQERAARARAGSRRKRDLEAAGMAPSRDPLEAAQRSATRRREAMAWVAEHLPELPEGTGARDLAAGALLRNDRMGQERTVANVKRRMVALWPSFPGWLKEYESEQGGNQ